jgi:hypothetical protein
VNVMLISAGVDMKSRKGIPKQCRGHRCMTWPFLFSIRFLDCTGFLPSPAHMGHTSPVQTVCSLTLPRLRSIFWKYRQWKSWRLNKNSATSNGVVRSFFRWNLKSRCSNPSLQRSAHCSSQAFPTATPLVDYHFYIQNFFNTINSQISLVAIQGYHPNRSFLVCILTLGRAGRAGRATFFDPVCCCLP